jgi:CrcB protein
MATWKSLLLLGLAGAVGTVARYGLTAWVQRIGGAGFPWGTLAVNGVGCLLFGLAVAVVESRFGLSPQLKLLVLTGFMGAFTTFSTFAFETTHLMRQTQWLAALGNLTAHNLVGVSLAVLGLAMGQWLLP